MFLASAPVFFVSFTCKAFCGSFIVPSYSFWCLFCFLASFLFSGAFLVSSGVFLVSSGVFPFRHGARPVSTFFEGAFVRKYIFGLSARHKTFLGTVETRRAACRQQRSTSNGGIQVFWKYFCTIFHFFLCLSANRRDGACPVSPANINKQRKNTIIQKWAFANFCFFLCLSLPTRGTPRLYRNTDAPRLYGNTFFGCLFATKPFCKP